jgi:IclR family acetate operon transcriptional repressor
VETRDAGNAPRTERLHSVKRTLAVLEALAARPNGATPKELSQALGLHLSTSYRLLNSLAAAGYVTRSPSTGLFRLGARIAYLHHGYRMGLRPPAEAVPFVHALQLATGETAMLNQLEGDDVVCTVTVAGSRPGAFPAGYVGMAAPAHAVAAGRALLARLPAARLDAYVSRRAGMPDSPFPLPDSSALRADLASIRQTGYAIDRGDEQPEVCCVAASVGGISSAEASLSVLIPRLRFIQDEPTLVASILAVAGAVGALQSALPPRVARADSELGEPEAATQAAIEAALASVTEMMSRVG